MASDPFSMVYSALWQMADETPELTSLVKMRNRIRYDTLDRNPEKRAYSDADCPELALHTAGLTGNLWASSTSSIIQRQYSWILITGDLRITERLMPVEWALFVAMHRWKEVLGALRWENKPFVHRMNMINIQEGVLRPVENMDAPRGWSAVWNIVVDFNFDTKDLYPGS